jgi:hypothetical protein
LRSSQAALPQSDEADAADGTNVDLAIAFAADADEVAVSDGAADTNDDAVSDGAADADDAAVPDDAADADQAAVSDNAADADDAAVFDDAADADDAAVSDNAADANDTADSDDAADADDHPNSDFDLDSDQDLDTPNATARGGFITPSAGDGQKFKEDAGHVHLSPEERKALVPTSPLDTPKGAQLEKAAALVKGKSSDIPVRGNADSDDEVIILGETRGTGEIPPSQATRASSHGRAPRRPLAPWAAQEDKEHDIFTSQHGNTSAAVNASARSRRSTTIQGETFKLE